MADYNLVQINGTYLTDTGLAGGMPCRVVVNGLPKLKRVTGGFNVLSRDRTPKRFAHDRNRIGAVVSLNVFALDQTVLDTIVGYHTASDTNGTDITLILTGGAFGDFNLSCAVGGVGETDDVQANPEFVDTQVSDVVLTYIVKAVN